MATITLDWTIRITDLAMLSVVALSPFIAVWATEKIHQRKQARDRKLHIFRSLMVTRQTTLSPSHVEALNLIDIEYDSSIKGEKPVIEAWKLYHAHLNLNPGVGDQLWAPKRIELLIVLLHTMAVYLKFPFNTLHLQTSSYYPRGSGEIEQEQNSLRRAALAVLEGRQPLAIVAPQPPNNQSTPKVVTPPPA